VENPYGASGTNRLLVADPARVRKEKEPNGGFRGAQDLQPPVTVDGAIPQAFDVDVYHLQGKAGQKLRAEILAARFGSALDATLTLHDARGSVLLSCDDTKESRDPLLEFTLPADGSYFLAVADAHDTGGITHIYWLQIQLRN